MTEIEEIEYQIEQIKKGDLDQITKDKIIKELENKKYILEKKRGLKSPLFYYGILILY